jgi:hypothetical protein
MLDNINFQREGDWVSLIAPPHTFHLLGTLT